MKKNWTKPALQEHGVVNVVTMDCPPGNPCKGGYAPTDGCYDENNNPFLTCSG